MMMLCLLLLAQALGAGPLDTELPMKREDLAAFNGWIDRIEGDLAVLLPDGQDDDQEPLVVPLASLPKGAREGLRISDGKIDRATTKATAARMRSLMDELVKLGEEGPKGKP